MIRKNTNSNSENVAVCRLGSGSPIFQYRHSNNLSITNRTDPLASKAGYKWAKLVLSNNTITGYIANKDDNWDPHGTGWEQIGSPVGINWASNYTFGLAAASNDAANPATVGILGVNWW